MTQFLKVPCLVDRRCQISDVNDGRNPVKKDPILFLHSHSLEVPCGMEVSHIKFQVSRMSETLSRRPLSTISRLDPWRISGS